MNAEEIINFIATAEKKTPVKLYVREKPGQKIDYAAHCDKAAVKVFGSRKGKVVFGDRADLAPVLEENADRIDYYEIENDCRNSAVPLLDKKGVNARIEPGRDHSRPGGDRRQRGHHDGAVINIGAVNRRRHHDRHGLRPGRPRHRRQALPYRRGNRSCRRGRAR